MYLHYMQCQKYHRYTKYTVYQFYGCLHKFVIVDVFITCFLISLVHLKVFKRIQIFCRCSRSARIKYKGFVYINIYEALYCRTYDKHQGQTSQAMARNHSFQRTGLLLLLHLAGLTQNWNEFSTPSANVEVFGISTSNLVKVWHLKTLNTCLVL